NVVGLTDAAERRLRFDPFTEVGFEVASGMNSFGFDHAGVERVYANLAGAEFLGKYAGDGVDGALGGGVHRRVGWRDGANAGADVDNAAAFWPDKFHGLLGDQQKAQYV